MNPDDFASLVNDDQFLYMEKEIARHDNRRHVDRKMDLQDRYVNMTQWRESKLAQDIEKTIQLLPKSGQEISVKDLKAGLRNYGITDDAATSAIREMGTNDRRIKARRNSYLKSKTIDDILLKRVDNFD